MERSQTLRKLALASTFYAKIAPALSRFYTNERSLILRKMGEKSSLVGEPMTCPYCSSLLRPGTYTVTLKPKRKMTRKVKRACNRKQSGILSNFQEKLLQSYNRSRNSLVVQCSLCGQKNSVMAGGRTEPLLKELKEDRTKAKRRQKAAATKTEKAPKMTAIMKKRLKKREKRREKHLRDSGLADSLTSGETHSDNISLSSISTVGGLNSSLSSEGTTSRLLSTSAGSPSSPFTTSTPKPKARAPVKQQTAKPNTLTGFLSTLRSSRGSPKSGKPRDQRKTPKGKKQMSVLKKMMSEMETDNTRQKGTLFSFLASVK